MDLVSGLLIGLVVFTIFDLLTATFRGPKSLSWRQAYKGWVFPTVAFAIMVAVGGLPILGAIGLLAAWVITDIADKKRQDKRLSRK